MASYAVVFDSTAVPQEQRDQLKARLADVFKLKPEQVAQLFRGTPVTVRKGLSREQADKFRAAFARAGARCEVVEQTAEGGAGRTAAAPGKPPAAAEMRPAKPAGLRTEDMERAFSGEVRKLPVPLKYRLGLLCVAVLMLLLPALYLGLIAGVGGFGIWYGLNGWSMLPSHRVYPVLFLYVMPLVVCLLVCVVMLKPLFAPTPHRPELVPLRRDKEPVLFALVDQICARVGAPAPSLVQVDCDVNASAGFRRGLRSFVGRDLVLTIGMPLVAGLNARQLAGVMAHEFGHFAQGAGMRTDYLVRSITAWFYRCVYERDRWDEALERWSEEFDMGMGIVLNVGRGSIWAVRRVLGGLMWLGTVSSRFMLRQMEFDADRYEAQVAGSAQFRDTAVRLRLLSHAYREVYDDLGRTWRSRQLTADLPESIARKADELAARLMPSIEAEMSEIRTALFDTHPADHERIANAERLADPGVFSLACPARALFAHYATLTQTTTRYFYRDELGLNLKEVELIAPEETDAAVAASRQEEESLRSYFHGFHCSYHFLVPLPRLPSAETDGAALEAQLRQQIVQVRQHGPEIRSAAERYAAAWEALPKSAVAAAMEEIGEESGGIARHQRELDAFAAAAKALRAWDRLMQQRLQRGLALAVHDQPALANEIGSLLAVQARLAKLEDTVRIGWTTGAPLHQLAWAAQDGVEIEARLLDQRLATVRQAASQVQMTLRGVPFPFRHPGDVDLLRYLESDLPPEPAEDDGVALANYWGGLASQLLRFHDRVMGRLASLAAAAETERGIRIRMVD